MAGSNNQNNNSVDYRELVEFFGEQFDEIYKEFDKVHQTLATKADRTDIDRVLTRIATINTKIDDYRAEPPSLTSFGEPRQIAMQR